MRKQKILIVEDDVKIAELLRDYLEHEGFDVSILNRGESVIYEVHHSHPNAILLDLMLPGKGGLTICREIRAFSRIPILIISAKVEEVDRLVGLEIGADDYICKPFSPKEVVARVKAVLRRISPEERLAAGPITIDTYKHTATIGGSDLHLTPNEFELLRVLVSRPGHVHKRDELVSKIQGHDFDGYDRTVDSHIKNLRKKIDEILPGNEIIETVYGVGYRINIPNSSNTASE
jgi:two-component system, OmpR family, response regulator BaeR